MKPSTIVHISTVHPLFDTRIFHKECKSLANAGINVKLIITHTQEEVIDNIHVIPLPLYKGRFKRIMLKPFLAFSKALSTRADVFHFHDPELLPMGLLLKLCGKKVVYDAHEDLPAQIRSKHWIHPSLRVLISNLVHGVESICSRFFDGIIGATPHVTNIFSKRNSNSVNINNYPLLNDVVDRNKTLTSKKNDEKSICYIGLITELRGIFELLDAIEGTDIKLYLAGNTNPRSLLKSLEQHKAWENVVFFGHVDRNELYSIMSKSQLGILLFHPVPNHMNCIPNKLFEYMCAGLPILASNFPFWKELTGDIDNIHFVDPLNSQEIRESIKNITANKEKCCSMGDIGIKAVTEKYNWEIEEKKLFAFYKKLGVRIT